MTMLCLTRFASLPTTTRLILASRTARVAALILASAALVVPTLGVAQQSDGMGMGAPSVAAAPIATDVLPAQVLGPDDLLEITVPYCPELSRSFRVGADGMLVLPLVKVRIPVAGRMPAEVGKEIAAALSAEQILNQPVVSIAVLEYRSRPVSVVGAVNHPITFQASRDTTLLDAITRAGGLSASVGPDITVTHHEQEPDGTTNIIVQSIPVKSLIEGVNPKFNIHLTGNDEIRVPDAGRIFVAGNVKKPGSFPMQDDSDTTVVKALALSEGLESYSSKYAYIYREAGPGAPRQEIQVALAKIMQRKAPDVVLHPDDILYVPENGSKRMTAKILQQIAGFGTNTAAGMLIYR